MTDPPPQIAVEVPVVKAGWLIPCIESVLTQRDPRWELLLAWDQGDPLSRRILEQLAARNHPRIHVHFHEARQGIAANRRFLTGHSRAPLILPLDDDDMLAPDAVARFIAIAEANPWASVLRARRGFIDESGRRHPINDWFPFEPRRYVEGMTADFYNHSQPVVLRRRDYDKTTGWQGFDEYFGAGEDCDIIAKLEEHGDIALLDEVLYYYRVHGKRASNQLGAPAAEDMWRRIADRTLARRRLPLRRENDSQPFLYRPVPRPAYSVVDVEVVIAHYPAEEKEVAYPWRRPVECDSIPVPLPDRLAVRQPLPPTATHFDRIEICCFSDGPVSGRLLAHLTTESGRVLASESLRLCRQTLHSQYLSLSLPSRPGAAAEPLALMFEFHAQSHASAIPVLARVAAPEGDGLLLRLFQTCDAPGDGLLARCVQSALANGVPESRIHVISRRASSAANRNAGINRCEAPLVCVIDDDAAFRAPGDLTSLLAGMTRLNVHLASPKILAPHGAVFCADPYFGPDRLPKPRGLGENDTGQYDYDRPAAWLPTTCLLFERSVALAAGGFDEHYTGSQLEDVDFCLRARARGFRCGYIGSAAVIHDNLQRNFSFGPNLPYFQQRWRNAPELEPIP